MAMLATLEGENGITLDDLFEVNDFLGVKYFGAPIWNKIKKYVCDLTTNAAAAPAAFYIGTLKEDYPNYKPSELSCELLGFNDVAGCSLMGSVPWERLKVKIDNDLLGWPSVGSAIRGGARVVSKGAKAVVSAPKAAIDYLVEETPLEYVPGISLTKQAYDYVLDQPRETAADVTQATQDIYSKAQQTLWEETPLKYTPTGYVVKEIEKGKEQAGILTPGTAGVYDSPEVAAAKEEAARAAALRHGAEASTQAAQTENLTRSVQLAQQRAIAAQEAAAQAAAEQAVTQQALDVMEARATSKYAPIIMAGMFGLLALSILKK